MYTNLPWAIFLISSGTPQESQFFESISCGHLAWNMNPGCLHTRLELYHSLFWPIPKRVFLCSLWPLPSASPNQPSSDRRRWRRRMIQPFNYLLVPTGTTGIYTQPGIWFLKKMTPSLSWLSTNIRSTLVTGTPKRWFNLYDEIGTYDKKGMHPFDTTIPLPLSSEFFWSVGTFHERQSKIVCHSSPRRNGFIII